MIKLTGFAEERDIFINPDNINFFAESKDGGTVIYFNGDFNGGGLHVKESAEEIARMSEEMWHEFYV